MTRSYREDLIAHDRFLTEIEVFCPLCFLHRCFFTRMPGKNDCLGESERTEGVQQGYSQCYESS